MFNDKNNIPLEEIDVPIQDTEYYVANKKSNEFNKIKDLSPKPNNIEKEWFTTIKGHNLLGWCIASLVLIYVVEICRGGDISEVGSQVIEVLKVLIFSVSGYLFGQRNK